VASWLKFLLIFVVLAVAVGVAWLEWFWRRVGKTINRGQNLVEMTEYLNACRIALQAGASLESAISIGENSSKLTAEQRSIMNEFIHETREVIESLPDRHAVADLVRRIEEQNLREGV
jgi:Flp pilus assembly protein TadB